MLDWRCLNHLEPDDQRVGRRSDMRCARPNLPPCRCSPSPRRCRCGVPEMCRRAGGGVEGQAGGQAGGRQRVGECRRCRRWRSPAGLSAVIILFCAMVPSGYRTASSSEGRGGVRLHGDAEGQRNLGSSSSRGVRRPRLPPCRCGWRSSSLGPRWCGVPVMVAGGHGVEGQAGGQGRGQGILGDGAVAAGGRRQGQRHQSRACSWAERRSAEVGAVSSRPPAAKAGVSSCPALCRYRIRRPMAMGVKVGGRRCRKGQAHAVQRVGESAVAPVFRRLCATTWWNTRSCSAAARPGRCSDDAEGERGGVIRRCAPSVATSSPSTAR